MFAELLSIGERPVGSPANERLLDFLLGEMSGLGYELLALPFDCRLWEKGPSTLTRGDEHYEIWASPFAKPFHGRGRLAAVDTVSALAAGDFAGQIVLLHGELVAEPLMPKEFPFYYPDEHKAIIDALERQRPAAVIAATGRHPMCGLDPFSLFEDGNFVVPSAYMAAAAAEPLLAAGDPVDLAIRSAVKAVSSRQLVAVKTAVQPPRGKIIICAHMDTKYETPGALDNAAGLVVLLAMMARLKRYQGPYVLEFVPFNGEEYYAVAGQLAYLHHLKKETLPVELVINIDAVGHKAGGTAVSFYNMPDHLAGQIEARMAGRSLIERGSEWYAGDHAMFAFQGLPCLAATSTNLFETVLTLTHTAEDTAEEVSVALLEETAEFLVEVVVSKQ